MCSLYFPDCSTWGCFRYLSCWWSGAVPLSSLKSYFCPPVMVFVFLFSAAVPWSWQTLNINRLISPILRSDKPYNKHRTNSSPWPQSVTTTPDQTNHSSSSKSSCVCHDSLSDGRADRQEAPDWLGWSNYFLWSTEDFPITSNTLCIYALTHTKLLCFVYDHNKNIFFRHELEHPVSSVSVDC